jgi:hypothetical protein
MLGAAVDAAVVVVVAEVPFHPRQDGFAAAPTHGTPRSDELGYLFTDRPVSTAVAAGCGLTSAGHALASLAAALQFLAGPDAAVYTGPDAPAFIVGDSCLATLH